jgi:hypothetical protein
VQLLRFENEEDTRLVSGFLNDVASIFSSDLLEDGEWAMLWADEQRGIGELMAIDDDGSSGVRGHAWFHQNYEKVLAPWMERFAGDVFSPAALKSDRLRLLQWAMFGLVRRLDEEGAYGPSGWTARAEDEIQKAASAKPSTGPEARLRSHLAELDKLATGEVRQYPDDELTSLHGSGKGYREVAVKPAGELGEAISGPPRVFVSYRRDDAPGYAGRLYDALASHLGAEQVLIDVEAPGPGKELLQEALGSTDVLIVVIGPRWRDERTPRAAAPG